MKIQKIIVLSLSMTCAIISAMEKEYQLLDQSNQQPSNQQQLQSLLTKKRIADTVYGTFVLGAATLSICNVIWEEPTLKNSDYFGSGALSVGNKINTAITLGLGLADIMWLLKPYCAFSNDSSQQDTWECPMLTTHLTGGITRSVVASLVGICAGIRRYPRTLTMLTVTGLLDFVGVKNAINHHDIAKEIEKLQSKSH